MRRTVTLEGEGGAAGTRRTRAPVGVSTRVKAIAECQFEEAEVPVEDVCRYDEGFGKAGKQGGRE